MPNNCENVEQLVTRCGFDSCVICLKPQPNKNNTGKHDIYKSNTLRIF